MKNDIKPYSSKIAKKTKDLDIPLSKRIKAGFELLVHKAYSFESDEHRKKTWLAKQKSILLLILKRNMKLKLRVHDELEKRYKFIMEQRFKNLTLIHIRSMIVTICFKVKTTIVGKRMSVLELIIDSKRCQSSGLMI